MILKTILAAIYAPFTLLPLYFLNYALVASYGISWGASIFLLLAVIGFIYVSAKVIGGTFKMDMYQTLREAHSCVITVNNLAIVISTSFSFFFLWDKNLLGSLLASTIGGVIALVAYMAAGILEGRMKKLKEAEPQTEIKKENA